VKPFPNVNKKLYIFLFHESEVYKLYQIPAVASNEASQLDTYIQFCAINPPSLTIY
jgi:hypothetical protein